jgi:hypothetical protein
MYRSYTPLLMSVIARPKINGGGEHWGVLMPGNLVAHNTPERGEHVSTLLEFAPDGKFRVVRHVLPNHFFASIHRIQKAQQSPGTYHATKNNCQSFANRVTGEKARSPTVDAIGLVALAGLFIFTFRRTA